MEKEIWNKASKDSIGIESYYNNNKQNYQWADRVDVVIASSSNKEGLEYASKLMKKGKSEETINTKLSETKNQNVIFTKGIYNVNDGKLPQNLKIKKGVSKIYKHNEAFHVIDIKAVMLAGQKSLEESRGNVINDYQNQLELDWLAGLYERFNVSVNESALRAVKALIEKQ